MCIFKWFIDACQWDAKVWLITTDTHVSMLRECSEMAVLDLLSIISQSGLSFQQSKWKRDLKSIGTLLSCQAVLTRKIA